MADVALVVPSIRKESFERFVREWRPTGLFKETDVLLMEDNPERTFDVTIDMLNHGESVTHFCWTDIDGYEWSWIIPRRSDTVRSFAYWWAWNEGYEYIMTLDDDCYPSPQFIDLVDQHRQMLDGRTRWYNTLNSVIPRGMPYYNRGSRRIMLNHGIWQGVLDYDAPHQLVDPQPEIYDYSNRIVPQGAYFPMCGMNVMWRRDVTVLMYHLLMGQRKVVTGADGPVLERLPFDRFGDIWCGILMKKVADHLGWSVSTGTPYIQHDRASNPFANLKKEASGIEVNEWFWERVDAVGLGGCRSVADCYHQLGRAISEWDGEYESYWKQLGKAMITWTELFDD